MNQVKIEDIRLVLPKSNECEAIAESIHVMKTMYLYGAYRRDQITNSSLECLNIATAAFLSRPACGSREC